MDDLNTEDKMRRKIAVTRSRFAKMCSKSRTLEFFLLLTLRGTKPKGGSCENMKAVLCEIIAHRINGVGKL